MSGPSPLLSSTCCPSCGDPFRVGPSPSSPTLCPCGHSVCASCVDAIGLVPSPACPVCASPVSVAMCVYNAGLGAFAEALLAEEGVPTESPSGDLVVPSVLSSPASPTEAAPSSSRPMKRRKAAEPIDDVSKIANWPPCNKHGHERASHFCATDSSFLCVKCVSSSHRGSGKKRHDVHPLGKSLAALHAALTDANATCETAADELSEAAARVSAARAGMVASCAASVAQYSAAIDQLKAALDAHRDHSIREAHALRDERAKTLDAQSEELLVSAAQLRACGGMCRHACTSQSPVDAAQALSSAAKTVGALPACTPTSPLCDTVVGVALIPTLPDAVNTLSSLSRVVRSGVNGSMTLVEGAGVKGFDISPPIGPPVDNTFTVTARDSEGNPVLDVEPEDLTVELSAKGGTQADVSRRAISTPVSSAVSSPSGPAAPRGSGGALVTGTSLVTPGTLQVSYRVTDTSITALNIALTLRGHALAPQKAHAGFRGDFKHIQTVSVPRGSCFGFAMSNDDRQLVMSEMGENRLVLYSFPDMAILKTIGEGGVGLGQFQRPDKLAWTPRDTIVVGEYDNRRIQEVDLNGAHIRFIGGEAFADGIPSCVTYGMQCLFVGTEDRTERVVAVYDYPSGALLRSFGTPGVAPRQIGAVEQIRCAPDGKHIIVIDSTANRLSLFTLTGRFVKSIGEGTLTRPADVCFAGNGDWIVTDWEAQCLVVFGGPTKKFLQSIGTHGSSVGEFDGPYSLHTVGSKLYVVESRNKRMQVFE